MSSRKLRWLYILPITFFVGFYEWVRHYPLEEFIEGLFPGWQENFFSVLLMMMIIVIFSHKLFVYYEKQHKELIIEREKLKLEKAKDSATIEERYRLAREIHDGLAQGLSFLNLRFKVLSNRIKQNKLQEAFNELEELSQVVHELYQEARYSIQDLKVISATGEDFSSYITNYLSKFEDQTGIKTSLEIPSQSIEISRKVELHLVRIIQEAMANIRKHSRAKNAVVKITLVSGGLLITVADDGIGIVLPEDDCKHYGLVIMQERAVLIGGAVSVATGENCGTIVTIEVAAEGCGGNGIDANNETY